MNDASIAKEFTSTCGALLKRCEEGDIMIIDRRFRDIVETGYEPKMPDFLTKGQNRYTLEQANRSPLITKVCWRTKSYHARMKKRMLFSGQIENDFIPKVADYVRMYLLHSTVIEAHFA